ncbi:hypothetical protein DNK47_00370 [Mycoplasma wenyonii]|uniref:Restriction endonuclease type II NgoFVII C-terminal B3-like DNA-binding domain-containing protein n=1 Tax=Mycoplasma wenyonii TaxID=65123 RepID=A0A328PKB9_9MOLU|nr:NgoFVII family restriction endonuclease [Mycoplasma wenyonii]RAO95302.1 hypothetical protein DNK47_00370 [Mycoplasma wenyonii]
MWLNFGEYQEVKNSKVLKTIILTLDAPTEEEVMNAENFDYLSKYPLNACYSKPLVDKKTGKKQSWYEVQFTVDVPYDLPSIKDWFYLVTDEGYVHKACFSGKRVKRLSTFKDREAIGAWIKSIFVEWQVLIKFHYVYQDCQRMGIVTKEALEYYGNNKVFIKKTDKVMVDSKGVKRDVWFISFPNKID